MTCEGDGKMEQLSVKEKEYFSKQLDSFIREIQERFLLSYEEAVWEIINGILHTPQFREKFYIQNNLTWNEKKTWIRNLKIVQKY